MTLLLFHSIKGSEKAATSNLQLIDVDSLAWHSKVRLNRCPACLASSDSGYLIAGPVIPGVGSPVGFKSKPLFASSLLKVGSVVCDTDENIRGGLVGYCDTSGHFVYRNC